MSKDLAFDNEVRTKLADGVGKLADAAKVTLGPKGRYVAMQIKRGKANVSNDGVTVAANIDLEDSVENIGMKVVREAAIGTNYDAGDGTTTATVLADAIVSEGVRNVVAGADPLALRRGIKQAADAVAEEVKKHAVKVTSKDQLVQIATVSVGDAKLGAKIGEAIDAAGKDGLVLVEKSQNFDVEVEYKRGMMFQHGFLSPYMADDMGRQTGELHEPYILLTDQRLDNNFRDLVPCLEEVIDSGHPILIIAEDVRGEALKTLVLNNGKGVLRSVAVEAPAVDERRKAELEDIAVATGGVVFSPERGLPLSEARKSLLGRAESARITADTTTIIGGKGKAEDIEARCAALRAEIATMTPGYDYDILRERLSKLAGGYSFIKVGAPTESELNEIRSRIQDALLATNSATEEGLVAGGGVALLQASKVLEDMHLDNPEEQHGVEILRRALAVPLKTIAANAGFESAVVAEKVKNLPTGHGLDCKTGEYGDMIAMGVTDPAKVASTVLHTAVSVACQILITNASVTIHPVMLGSEGEKQQD